MNQPAPGWYPDPSGGGQRYWDGEKWGPIAPPSAPATQVIVKRSNAGWIILAILIGIPLFILGSCAVMIGSVVDSDEKSSTTTTGSTSARASSSTSHAPIGPTMNPEPGKAYKIDDCFLCTEPPGTWESAGPTGWSGTCEWVIQRDLVGDAGSLIDSGSSKSGPIRVRLKLGQYFTSTNCATWRYIG